MKNYRFLIIFTVIITILPNIDSKLIINKKLLEMSDKRLSQAMCDFMKSVIVKNSHEKDGFLLTVFNKIEPELSDFVARELNKNASVIIQNFDVGKVTKSTINANRFKFVLVDPEGDLIHAETLLNKIRWSRRKLVLILTKPPSPLMVEYLLASFLRVQCINVIVAYEIDYRIEIFTINPYLPSSNKYVNLTTTIKYGGDLFQEKSNNLYGHQINALLTHKDYTKTQYNNGKDYTIMQTIISHLNGKLNIISLSNKSMINPWLLSINNRTQLERIKQDILNRLEISLLIKPESFTINDGIVENVNPHRQNDLVVLVPKSSRLSLFKSYTAVLTLDGYGVGVAFVVLEKRYGRFTSYRDVYFQILRMHITNSLTKIPKNPVKKLVFLGFVCYCFVFNTAIISKIISFLTGIHYEPEIDTIEGLIKARLKIYALPNDIGELRKKYIQTDYQEFIESLIPIELNIEELENIIYKNVTTLETTMKISSLVIEQDLGEMIVKNRLLYHQNVPIYHLVEESLMPSYQSFKIRHGSPLLPTINKQLRKLEEAGFVKLWSDWSIYHDIINGNLYATILQDDLPVERLNLKTIKIPLTMIGIFYVITIIVFLLELSVRFCKPNM